MQCRPGCAACCIAPSISSPLPGMPDGKPAGVPCIHLDENKLCKLFAQASRPNVCIKFSATPDICGETNEQAFFVLKKLEQLTSCVSN